MALSGLQLDRRAQYRHRIFHHQLVLHRFHIHHRGVEIDAKARPEPAIADALRRLLRMMLPTNITIWWVTDSVRFLPTKIITWWVFWQQLILCIASTN